MRIISGTARGTKINTIDGMSTRPTLDRVKESLFNIIQNRIKDSIVLDLFAGSGALGIEALSRGANKAVFCDLNNKSVHVIKQNLDKTKLTSKSIVLNMDYKKCLKRVYNDSFKFDIVFLDPPYKFDLAVKALDQIINLGLLNYNGLIILETDEILRDETEIKDLLKANEKNNYNIHIVDKRKYGRANLLFLGIDEEI